MEISRGRSVSLKSNVDQFQLLDLDNWYFFGATVNRIRTLGNSETPTIR